MHSIPDPTVPAGWRTSTYSQPQNCVEVGDLPGAAAVRDSQHREHGHLTFPVSEWRAFLAEARAGAL